jgi:hypothetical protein
MQEATMLQEVALVADLDLRAATGERAAETLSSPMAAWWREGVKRVPIVR